MQEDEVIKRISNGDTQAIEELVQLYYQEIFRYCCRHTLSRYAAEDATQETFLKAIRYFGKYSHRGMFRAFLYKIAKNTCIDLQRKKCAEDIQSEQLLNETVCIEEGYTEVQEKLQLLQLVKNLPENVQEIVVLRFSQELSMREIAKIINLPMRTVQSQLRSALKKLKKEMNKDGKK